MHKAVSATSVIVLMLLFPGTAPAGSADSLVTSGNEAYRQGDYEAALDNYDRAAEVVPDSAVILFNRGDALYRQDKYSEAFDAFEQAAARALAENDRGLEAKSRYNMGNSAYRRAESLQRQNPARALEEFKRSEGYFHSAIKLDPDLSEAAHNLEAARVAAKQIEEQMRRQQEEARQQEQQKQDLVRELENLQQEQQQAAERSNELGRSGGQEDAGAKVAQQIEKQQSITGKTMQAGEKLEQMNSAENPALADKMAREHVKRAVARQEEAEKNLRENETSRAHENQQEAAVELEKALQQLQQEGKGDEEQEAGGRQGQERPGSETSGRQSHAEKQQPQQQQPGDVTGQPGNIPGARGLETPEDIINEERENRKSRSSGGGAGYEPVDKDW